LEARVAVVNTAPGDGARRSKGGRREVARGGSGIEGQDVQGGCSCPKHTWSSRKHERSRSLSLRHTVSAVRNTSSALLSTPTSFKKSTCCAASASSPPISWQYTVPNMELVLASSSCAASRYVWIAAA